MSATRRDYTSTVADLLETYDVLGVDDQNVRQEAKDDHRGACRLKCWSWLCLLHTSLSVTRKGEALAVLKSTRRNSHIHVRRGENGTGLTPTIANLSAGDEHNGKVGLAALRLMHLFCSLWRNVFGALLEDGFAETKPNWPEWMHGKDGEGRTVNWSRERRVHVCAQLEWHTSMI